MEEDFYPAKSHFELTDRLAFFYLGSQASISYKVFHFETMVFSGKVKVFKDKKGKNLFRIQKIGKKGAYGIEIEGKNGILSSSFEIGINPLKNPHYGFLTDFTENANDDYLDYLLKLHINIVQYYDWMYRHEDYIAPANPFIDPMGKSKSQKIVKAKIDECHEKGILSFAYGAVYGATNEFAALHSSWAFYDGKGKMIPFIDRFTIMNFVTSPWRDCLLNNYKKAIEVMGFDGIHMDTYGSPKEAFSYDKKHIRFEKEFPLLINEASKKLKNIGSAVTFNNVGAWPLSATAKTKTAFDYVEVWNPLSEYEDLLTLVRWQRSLSDKPMVIAAYLSPYYEDNDEKASYANAFLSSILYAAGAHHLIYGEDGRVLRTGYYLDNHKLSQKAFLLLRRYEDFACRYGEFIYDNELRDVSLTHSGGDNKEYVFEDPKTKVKPAPGSFLVIVKEKKGEKIIHFLNLTNQTSTLWNQEKEKPQKNQGTWVDVLVEDQRYEIFATSPDHPELKKITSVIALSDQGYRLRFHSGVIGLWKMIVLKKREN
jgi:dextranase